MNQKRVSDKLTFYRYPLNYLVHWMIPLFFELFLYSILIPFSTISESFNLIFSFFLIYLSFKNASF